MDVIRASLPFERGYCGVRDARASSGVMRTDTTSPDWPSVRSAAPFRTYVDGASVSNAEIDRVLCVDRPALPGLHDLKDHTLRRLRAPRPRLDARRESPSAAPPHLVRALLRAEAPWQGALARPRRRRAP